MTHKPAPAPRAYDPTFVEDLAVEVYKIELGPKDAASMMAKDGDGGAKLRRRAQAYASIVRSTLDAMLLLQNRKASS